MELAMHLTDCFMPLVAYVAYFQKTAATQQPSYDQVKADILRLLSQSEGWVKKGVFTQEDYDAARFALCAWVDEGILNSPGTVEDLQSKTSDGQFGGDSLAGERRTFSGGQSQRYRREGCLPKKIGPSTLYPAL